MRFIATYALTSRTNAIIATAMGAAIPMCFWVAAAVVGLITLRKGSQEGSTVMLWGSLPAVFWLSQGDPTPALVIIGVMLMAMVLRSTVSWSQTLVAGAVMGAITGSTVEWLPPEIMSQLAELGREMISGSEGLAEQAGIQLDQFLINTFTGMISAFHTLVMALSLILARWWQAREFNPGGFQLEFHQLRLSVWSALTLGIVIVFGAGVTPEALKWIPSLTIPLALACIALVHGVVTIKQLSKTWLTVFYVLLFIMGHSLYVFMIFVAFLDSALNFRQRLTTGKTDL
ncbi:hypothetical protein [Oceanospirillum sediminis]|uniref:DUF2232 domain-containing protein n=1 Tax=Oceanospirillum sediminis TaxID=2760088 RepID=A0A839ILP8_9GAMM|nr:hypothetical protein [Oceanospirillum sediminis]MBB1485246.1 hypothetical protein [Oceanospirillum sediminis]